MILSFGEFFFDFMEILAAIRYGYVTISVPIIKHIFLPEQKWIVDIISTINVRKVLALGVLIFFSTSSVTNQLLNHFYFRFEIL